MTEFDHVALVTGSSRGLGRAMALALAGPGTHVIVHYRNDDESAKETARLIEQHGGSSTLMSADLTSIQQIESLLDNIDQLGLSIDILVNNAGAIIRPASWQEQSDEDMVRTTNLNLLAPMRLIRLVAPKMIERGFGRIVNITSTYAITGAAPVLAYTAAKAGIISLTYSMARELGPHGITVNAIAPGNIDTDMTQSAGPDTIAWAVSTTPLARLGTPAEVAGALRYLLDADFVTGHVLVVDGGQLLNM
jgi:3-oxoacyl-[acyl-carrier protein] reductase